MFSGRFFLVFIFILSLFGINFAYDSECLSRDFCTNLSSRSPLIYDDEEYFQKRNCFCDSQCKDYGDCCYSSSKSTVQYECIDYLLPTITNKTLPFYRLSVWMKTECLQIYHGSPIESQCRNIGNQSFQENPILFIPVTSSQTNVTYRNYYCAYCNNEFDEYLRFWEYKSFCPSDGTEQRDYLILDNDQEANYYLHNLTKTCTKTIVYPHENQTSQPSVFIRPCKQSISASCPLNTSIDLAQNCSISPINYRYLRNSEIIYRNPYCAQCHHSANLSATTCHDPNLRSAMPPMTLTRTQPLSILFDPNLLKSYLTNSDRIYSTNYTCSRSNELYDLTEQKCTKVTDRANEFITSMTCSIPIQTNTHLNETISYENGSLFIQKHSIYLNRNEYIIFNDNRILFCADQWLANQNLSLSQSQTIPFYRSILSIIFTSISLVCLCLFIVIYSLIPSLHNLPGKCLLFLSISLFVGQLMFISTSNRTENYWLCFVSANLVHFFYLSSFIWLLVLSIHIHSTFNQNSISQDKQTRKTCRLLVWNVCVWLSSGLIVLIANLIQIFEPESNYSPGYASIVCSISKVNAMICFFLVPIGLILFVVSILFVKTIWIIFQSHRAAKSAELSSSANFKDRNFVFIYARLACLMGIQWVLLLVALIVGQTWLWIIFEIVNSLPGLFICLGFLCSKRVFKTLKQKSSSRTSPTMLTSSSTLSKTIRKKIFF